MDRNSDERIGPEGVKFGNPLVKRRETVNIRGITTETPEGNEYTGTRPGLTS